ncbi:hypothetical protein CL614_03935 [archaeon]|nr:hypothetical protein [archaeon]|tara:strand:+ start:456 stop:1076 length:621 start_codon:yes stop_codon:yes gene_type:complete
MGRSDPIILPIYNGNIPRKEPAALLGYTKNVFGFNDVTLFDLEIGNWNINSDWKLDKKYKSIICTRCPYFAKNPEEFIQKCYENLDDNGEIFLDWGLGDHWRFKSYKIGWTKDNEQEYAYEDDNFLWSAIWDESFLNHKQYKIFENMVKKFDYSNVKEAIFKEVPHVLELSFIKKYFHVQYEMLALWEDSPQLYIFIKGIKSQNKL